MKKLLLIAGISLFAISCTKIYAMMPDSRGTATAREGEARLGQQVEEW